jgi:hypothetical protein
MPRPIFTILGGLFLGGLGGALAGLVEHRSEAVTGCAATLDADGGCTSHYMGDVTVLGVAMGVTAGVLIAFLVAWWLRRRHFAHSRTQP